MPLSAADLAVDTSGTIHGGGYPTSLLGPNYFCGGAAFTFPATNPPFSDVVQDIGRDDTGNVYAAVANPGAATIYQIAGCMPPGTALAVLPGVFVGKISLPSAILAFGNSCPNSLGLLPTIATVGTPVAGGSWTLDITNAIPNNVAFGVFGRDPISPLNIGSTNGCFLVISRILVLAAPVDGLGNATLTVNLPPALSGLPLFAQWAFRDAALNPIGIGLTSGLRVNL